MSCNDWKHKSRSSNINECCIRNTILMNDYGTNYDMGSSSNIYDHFSMENIQKSMTSRTRCFGTRLQYRINVQTLRIIRTTSIITFIPTIIIGDDDYKLFQSCRKILKTLDIWTRYVVYKICIHTYPRIRQFKISW